MARLVWEALDARLSLRAKAFSDPGKQLRIGAIGEASFAFWWAVVDEQGAFDFARADFGDVASLRIREGREGRQQQAIELQGFQGS